MKKTKKEAPKVFSDLVRFDESALDKVIDKLVSGMGENLRASMSSIEARDLAKAIAMAGVDQGTALGFNSVNVMVSILKEMGRIENDVEISISPEDSAKLQAPKYIELFELPEETPLDETLKKARTLVNDNTRSAYRETIQVLNEKVPMKWGDKLRSRHKAEAGACDFCCMLESYNADVSLAHNDCRCSSEQFVADKYGDPVFYTEPSPRMEKFYEDRDKAEEEANEYDDDEDAE